MHCCKIPKRSISVIASISLKLNWPSTIPDKLRIGCQNRKCSKTIERKQWVEQLPRFDIETALKKSTWKTHQYFVDFESPIHVEISTSNRFYNFHVDSPFKINEISTNFPRGISTSNRWWIDEDVPIGYYPFCWR